MVGIINVHLKIDCIIYAPFKTTLGAKKNVKIMSPKYYMV